MTTIDDLQNYLLIEIDPAHRPAVQGYIDTVTRYIQSYTGRDFSTSPAFSDRYFDGTGSHTLYIDDATEVSEVSFFGTGSLPVDMSGTTSPYSKIVLQNYIFPQGEGNIRVRAKWGAGAVPEDLKFAATVLVAGIISNQNTNDNEIQSMSIGRYSVTYKQGSKAGNDMPMAQEIIKHYKRYA